MRLPVPGTGRSTHPANWERRGSPGGGAGQERKRKNAPAAQGAAQLPPPPHGPAPAAYPGPQAGPSPLLRVTPVSGQPMPDPPELLPWPPGPSQRLCCSRPPAGTQSRGTPAVAPAQGLCEMREIVSPGRRPPAPAALPSLCLRFPVDVLLQGPALPPCPGSPPAVPASRGPAPRSWARDRGWTGSALLAAWARAPGLAAGCPQGLCSASLLEPGQVFWPHHCLGDMGAPHRGHREGFQPPPTSQIPEVTLLREALGRTQDKGGVLGWGPGQARGPALGLTGPQALAPSAHFTDGQLRFTWATANCLPTRKGGRRAHYLARYTTHCARTLCARPASGSVAQL